MKIYISIPITGRDPKLQKARAASYALSLRKIGHEPVNPFDTPSPPKNLTAAEEYAYYIMADIDRLRECDAIFLSPGWITSRGCCIEHLAARSAGLKIFEHFLRIPHNKSTETNQ